MNIKVYPHTIEIVDSEPINEKEVNISKCHFEFEMEIPDNYVKEAYFTLNGNTYKQIIINDECDYPSEVLVQSGDLEIGVAVYKVEDEEYIKLYNPTPTYFKTWRGSLKDAENSEPITPTDKEQIEQMLANINIDANKVGRITTITYTNIDGEPHSVEILDGIDGIDGKSLENIEIDNRDLKVTYGGETENLGQVAPNIQIGTTTTITPSQPARVENVGTDINPIFNFYVPKGETGAVKIRIVNELPQTGEEDTFYLVPRQEGETQDIYDEYIWINNAWELVGEKQIEVDLSDYAKKSELPTALSQLSDDTTHRLVSDTEKTTWNNKLDSSDLTDYVKNTDYASSSTGGVIKTETAYNTTITSTGKLQANVNTYEIYLGKTGSAFISKGTLENVITGKDLTTKSYVDGLVGDIETILTTLDIGSGV